MDIESKKISITIRLDPDSLKRIDLINNSGLSPSVVVEKLIDIALLDLEAECRRRSEEELLQEEIRSAAAWKKAKRMAAGVRCSRFTAQRALHRGC